MWSQTGGEKSEQCELGKLVCLSFKRFLSGAVDLPELSSNGRGKMACKCLERLGLWFGWFLK
jgi:hypothetical protein